MEHKDYTISITIATNPTIIYSALTTGVAKWWGGKDLSGNTKSLNDEFIIHHPGAHYSKKRVIDLIPGKKVVWLVAESKLSWLKNNKEEWTNTKMVFEFMEEGDCSVLRFTHEGLVAEMECFEMCTKSGWEIVINDWLFHFVTEGKPHF